MPKFEAQVFARSVDYFNSYSRPSKSESATKLARCLGIINIYHPFPEGNGRAQRIFIYLLASVFQYSTDWDQTSPWEIVETSKQVHKGNYEAIESLIQRIIVDKS